MESIRQLAPGAPSAHAGGSVASRNRLQRLQGQNAGIERAPAISGSYGCTGAVFGDEDAASPRHRRFICVAPERGEGLIGRYGSNGSIEHGTTASPDGDGAWLCRGEDHAVILEPIAESEGRGRVVAQ